MMEEACFYETLLLYHEDGGSSILRDFGNDLSVYTASHPKKPKTSYSSPWERCTL
jgi:hypothetical protein